ncbi:hypothetical protein INR49_029787, partial [Caranx melampygus]
GFDSTDIEPSKDLGAGINPQLIPVTERSRVDILPAGLIKSSSYYFNPTVLSGPPPSLADCQPDLLPRELNGIRRGCRAFFHRVLEQSEAARVVMAMSQERSACLGLWVLLLLGAGMEEVVEGCSCHPAHPQQLFCSAEIVIRAKISGEKIVSPSNSSSPYMKMIQYEIKMIKMFKGFDKAKDIQYVYTPVFSSLCGVKLDSNNKAGYLLSGSMWSDGRISIGQCDLVESWDNLSLSQKKNLNYRYQMGCECRINTCYTVPCASTGENECLWTDWLLDNSLNGEQARQYACIRRSDTTCSWYRGGPPPEKDFLDMTDP